MIQRHLTRRYCRRCSARRQTHDGMPLFTILHKFGQNLIVNSLARASLLKSLHRTPHDERQTSQRHDISSHVPRPRWQKRKWECQLVLGAVKTCASITCIALNDESFQRLYRWSDAIQNYNMWSSKIVHEMRSLVYQVFHVSAVTYLYILCSFIVSCLFARA